MQLTVTLKVNDQSEALRIAEAMNAVSLGRANDPKLAYELAARLYGVPVIAVNTKGGK